MLPLCESWGKNLELESSVEEGSWARRHEETVAVGIMFSALYCLCCTVRIITPINVRLAAYVTCNLEKLNPCTILGVKDMIADVGLVWESYFRNFLIKSGRKCNK